MVVMKQLLLYLVVSFSLFRCSVISGSYFWIGFQREIQTSKNNNQGPRGGYLQISWQANSNNHFKADDLINFTAQNGWKYVDSITITEAQLKFWKHNNKDVFPLTNKGFDNSNIVDNASFKYFPREIITDLTVLRFKTNVLLFESGTDKNTDINGFVLISKSRSQISVYHYWGE